MLATLGMLATLRSLTALDHRRIRWVAKVQQVRCWIARAARRQFSVVVLFAQIFAACAVTTAVANVSDFAATTCEIEAGLVSGAGVAHAANVGSDA